VLQVWRVRGGCRGGGVGGECARCGQRRQLLTSKVVLQGSEEVADDWHTPRFPKHLLPLLPIHVPYISVMFGETKNSGGTE